MAIRSNGGKRAQEKRAAETIKGLVGDTEAELGRFRRELDQLIASGQVARVLRVRDMSEDLFAMWQGVQDLKDSTAVFVACCREYYDRQKRSMPAVIALREELIARGEYTETRRLMRHRSRIARLMRSLKATLGELPAGKAKAVRRVLNEELGGSAGKARAS